MTIYQLAALNKKNNGEFFSRDNMRGAGDTMRNFGIRKSGPNRVTVYRKRPTRYYGLHQWEFDAITGRVIYK